MAYANVLQYLENQNSNIFEWLGWNLPHAPNPGYGDLAGGTWSPDPEDSLPAQICTKTQRAGTVDFDSGSGSTTCQRFDGLFKYMNENGVKANYAHQGDSGDYGSGELCDE